jgi:hypothetical protein
MAQLALGQMRTTMRATVAVPPRAAEAGTAALRQQVSARISCGQRVRLEAILSSLMTFEVGTDEFQTEADRPPCSLWWRLQWLGWCVAGCGLLTVVVVVV